MKILISTMLLILSYNIMTNHCQKEKALDIHMKESENCHKN